MKLTGIAPWYGAKRKAALRAPILAMIGNPVVLVEPFCGSCAVSLAAEADVQIVNDLHRDLFNLALVLKEPELALALYEQVERALFSEEQYHACLERLQAVPMANLDPQALPNLDRAFDFLYMSWSAHNGFAGTMVKPRFNVRYAGGGGDPAVRWRSVAESIPEWHRRMRTWTILNRDAFDLIGSINDRPGTVLYVDSPYHRVARSDATYYHDFVDPGLFDPVDKHAELRDLLQRFQQARVIISHYDCQPIRELYAGPEWQVRENYQGKNIARAWQATDNTPNDEDREAPEILITNRSVP